MLTDRQAVIAELRESVDKIEGAKLRPRLVLPFGVPSIDSALPGGGLAYGAVHEIAGGGADAVVGACSAMFIAGIAARTKGSVVWCLTRADIYAPALAQVGLHPDRVIYVESADEAGVMASVEEALRYGGLGAVVGEIVRLSMTDSRRFQLAAEQSGMDYKTLKEARVKVAKAIEAANRYTNVETLQGTKKFRLKSLAIPGRLSRLSTAEIASAKMAANGPSTNYLGFRRQFDRAIILGDPGGGKSTLTQLVCFDLARIVALEDGNPGRTDYDVRDLKIPLRIVLRSFEAKQEADPSYTLFDYLRDDLKIALDSDDSITASFLQNVLSTGEAVIIFDGLDEVLELGARRNIVGYIEQFSEIYAACPVLVTSRLVGYRDAPLSDDFEPYRRCSWRNCRQSHWPFPMSAKVIASFVTTTVGDSRRVAGKKPLSSSSL